MNKLELESRDTRFNNNYAKEAKSGGKKENNINRNVLPKIEEIKIQQKLQHKNIAKYYDYCDLKEYGCIVMELADYGDLDFFKKKFIHNLHPRQTLDQGAVFVKIRTLCLTTLTMAMFYTR